MLDSEDIQLVVSNIQIIKDDFYDVKSDERLKIKYHEHVRSRKILYKGETLDVQCIKMNCYNYGGNVVEEEIQVTVSALNETKASIHSWEAGCNSMDSDEYPDRIQEEYYDIDFPFKELRWEEWRGISGLTFDYLWF